MKKYKFVFDNKIDSLPKISDFLDIALEEMNVDPATSYQIHLVVDEACTNIISYAYGDKHGFGKLVFEKVADTLIITLTDNGKPFDPTAIPLPDIKSGVEDRKIGGLGIFFMKQMMDEVSYSYDPVKGNQLRLIKKLRIQQ
ncbi:MAG: ATP-binding protein [Chloroflexi bacterium]|nr:ATP-binding protein [Chloroflexota bacterium]